MPLSAAWNSVATESGVKLPALCAEAEAALHWTASAKIQDARPTRRHNGVRFRDTRSRIRSAAARVCESGRALTQCACGDCTKSSFGIELA